jgi:translation initiation factor IF-2
VVFSESLLATVRVSALAKEEGVTSAWILEKLKAENLGDKAKNASSALGVGLAETVREWAREFVKNNGGAVAVAESAPKTSRARSRKRADGSSHDDGHHGEHHAEEHRDDSGGEQESSDQGGGVAVAAGEAPGGGGFEGETGIEDQDGAEAQTDAGGDAGGDSGVVLGGSAEAAGENTAGDLAGDSAGDSAESKKSRVAVKPVAFTPMPAKGSGPRVVVAAPTQQSVPKRFGQKVPGPVGTPKPAAKAPAKPPVAGKQTAAAAGQAKPAVPTHAPGRAPGTPGSLGAPPAPPATTAPAAAGTAPAAQPPTTAAPAGAGSAANAGAAAATAQGGASQGGGTAHAGGAAHGGTAHGGGRTSTHPDGSVVKPALRQTITLQSRQGPQAAGGARAPVAQGSPPPKLTTPEPAKISGPRIVRIEQADHAPLPRARRPMGQMTNETPSFQQARPGVGRGVRVTEEEEDEAKKAAKKGSLSTRRRGVDGRRGEADERLREFTDADIIARRDALNAAAAARAATDRHLRQQESKGLHVQAKSAVERGGILEIEEPISVKSLSSEMGVKSSEILGKLLRKGIFANINQTLTFEQAEEIALGYGLELKVKTQPTAEEQLVIEFEARSADPTKLVLRPPVVTILGHVDHGKTSLLDKIRNANVAAGEAGGITQHTAAWQVTVGKDENAKRVTFIDTPGHQAFTAMRARGANMTDIVVLVVSAAEGVQPQTVESINHARAAGVPIIVALNKIDRADANPDMVMGQLAKEELNPVEWGGQTEMVKVSAQTGAGINELIELLGLQAEILELKTDPTGPARGTVIESRVDEGLGSVATVLVQDGELKPGDVVLVGGSYGRIRSIFNDLRKPLKSATAAMPVIISGLNGMPSSGEKFYVVKDIDLAKSIAEERATANRFKQLAAMNRSTADSLRAQINASDIRTINVIIKGDVHGSVETLVATVTAQNTDEVKVRVVHSGVGPVTESDVQLAMATRAKPTDNRIAIIGFNVVPEEPARALAEQHHIDVKTYRVIYEIFDDLKKALSGMLSKEVREKLHGHVEVRQVFKVSKLGNVAGCFVTDGHIQRGSKIRLLRSGTIVTQGISIESLKRLKDDAKEVKSGLECGIKLSGYDDIKVGDVFEAYVTEEFERTL